MTENKESVLDVCKGVVQEASRKEKLLKQYQEEKLWIDESSLAPLTGSALRDLEVQLAACYKQERVNLKRLQKACTRALKHFNSKNLVTTRYQW